MAASIWYGVSRSVTPRKDYLGVKPGDLQIASQQSYLSPTPAERSQAIEAPLQAPNESLVESSDTSKWRIVDESGLLLEGVEAHVLSDLGVFEPGQAWEPIPQVRPPLGISSDKGTIMAVESFPPGRYILSKPGFVSRLMAVGQAQADDTLVELLRPRGGKLVFVDNLGSVIPNVRLIAPSRALNWPTFTPSDAWIEIARTESNGVFVLWDSIVAGSTLMATHDDFAPQFFNVPDLDSGLEHTIVLSKCDSISGRVFAGSSGAVSLAVLAERDEVYVPSPRFLPIATVPKDGQFHLDGLVTETPWKLTPCVLLGDEWMPAGEPVTAYPPAVGVELYLHATFGLQARIRGINDTLLQPAVLTSVMPKVVLAGPGEIAHHATHVTSTWSGLVWPFGSEPSATVELWLQSPGYATLALGSVRLTASQSNDLGDFQLEPIQPWPIRVIDARSREPLPEAIVRFVPDSVADTGQYNERSSQEARSDEDGVAVLACTADSGLLVVDDQRGSCVFKQHLDVVDCSEKEVEIEHPAFLTVACRTAEGSPVPWAGIQWRPLDVQDWRPIAADEAGMARLEVQPGDVLLRYAPGSLQGRTQSGGTVNVDVHADDEGQPRPSKQVTIEGLQAGESRTVELAISAMSELKVFVAVDNRPAGGCRLVVVPGSRLDVIDNDLWNTFDLPRAIVPDTGVVAVCGVPLGRMMLCVSLPTTHFVGYLVIEAHRPIEGIVDFDIYTEEKAVSVIKDDGTPVPGIEVTLRQVSLQQGVRLPLIVNKTPSGSRRTAGTTGKQARAITDSQGVARFLGVPQEGAYEAYLEGSALGLVAPCRLPRGIANGTLREGTGAALDLTLVWDDGTPASGVGAMVYCPDTRFRVLVSASDQGVLRVKPPGQLAAHGRALTGSVFPSASRLRGSNLTLPVCGARPRTMSR